MTKPFLFETDYKLILKNTVKIKNSFASRLMPFVLIMTVYS